MNQSWGRGAFASGRGGFNPSTSRDNHENIGYGLHHGGEFNTFATGADQENIGSGLNRDGRNDGLNPFNIEANQERHEPAQGGFATNRGGTFNPFTTGANQENIGNGSNRGGLSQSNVNREGSNRGGRGASRGRPRNPVTGNPAVNANIADGRGYVPRSRQTEELFNEDQRSEALYATVVDGDEDVVVEQFGQALFCLRNWEAAEFEPQLLTNVKERAKYIRPRKIQSLTLPLALDGFDVISQAETGSGKTAAFLLSIIDSIMKAKLTTEEYRFVSELASPFAIIIAPTRELAQQIYEQATKFADKTGVSIAKAYGKYNVGPNHNEIRFGCDILIGTPGRLMQFIKSGEVRVKNLRTLVLDEADRLCDGQFLNDILDIVIIPGFPGVYERQTLFFSATFPPQALIMTDILLRPEAVFVTNHQNLPNKRIKQDFIVAGAQSKLETLADILTAEADKVGGAEKIRRTLVFVNTKQMSDMAALFLCQRGIRALSINGDRPQYLRQQALFEFRTHRISVLCATDVCARGIDVKNLDHVINMDLPRTAFQYIHRIGRTGRITQGYSTTFFAGNEPLLKEIAKMLREQNEEIPETLKAAVAAYNVFGDDDSVAAPDDQPRGFAS
uniref:RNA helicase n=1 Tax=Panagrolaimus sp. PS1159 TaxID=55785 RepID=A0AC35GDA7_9BILA